ncbi:hypothetical protein Tsubulata_020714 [Turnera subulata]|uniref:Endonuclease/exonuclease/phosphatase domain-containing protein n=1 Tax=Turnera subulata TaxID=218843 RepID=A0A9Q0J169_9ROSI|nr:hypothetical protein Tsubulata_020714 [Turnera subulata]
MLVVIVEPRISGRKADRVIKKLGFRRTHRVEARGLSGGIWLLWKEALLSIRILINHAQFIHMKVLSPDGSFIFTAVYGSPNEYARRFFWRNLEVLAPTITEPWMLAGDFNALLCSTERLPRGNSRSGGIRDFQSCVLNTGLLDLGFSGPKFTWHRGQLKQRLDRMLANPLWANQFPQAGVYHLPFFNSDHRPLLIKLEDRMKGITRKQRFQFQAVWSSHESYAGFVQQNWIDRDGWTDTLQTFTDKLQQWQHTIS